MELASLLYFNRCVGWIVLFSIGFLGCSPDEQASPDPRPIELKLPRHFPAATASADNPLTVEAVALGRRLFYDVRLSSNNKISCATCHAPKKAFTDGIALSTAGVSGTKLFRHSPALINLAWVNNGLFWDGGSTNLESQAFAPLAAHDEMDQNLYELIVELKEDPWYVGYFQKAFQDTIKSAYIVRALAQFQRTLISGSSRYDAFALGDQQALSPLEKEGLAVFMNRCSSCHQPPLFTDNLYHNNGLDADFSDESHERIHMGRFRISFDPADLGKFKTPTLRNIALTAPYMHDGRFQTLEEVLTHYSSGIKESETLDAALKNSDGSKGISLSESEKIQLLGFLRTLTDSSFIRNPDFTDPFQ